jgi:hypothetical protein
MTSNPEWGPGPWDDEPDELEWRDARTGLRCKLRRNSHMGILCGYVGVPPGHSLFGWDYHDDIKLKPEFMQGSLDEVSVFSLFTYDKEAYENGTIPLDIALKVHGGLTWTEEEGGLWWFGFDCGHAFDLSPGLQALYREHNLDLPDNYETYRDVNYVKQQCTDLAFQLKQLEAAMELTTTLSKIGPS